MKYGNHGKRNQTSTNIIFDILSGFNTSDELKFRYNRKMTLQEAILKIKPNSVSPLTDNENEELTDRAREYRDAYNKKFPISNKAVEYHLRRLTNDGLIVKKDHRYNINFRSNKAIRKILFLMRDLPANFGFKEGFYNLMDIWASVTGTETKEAIDSPDIVQEMFWDYTIDFMSVPKNLRDFYKAWFYDSYHVDLELAKLKEELKARYRMHFDPYKHHYNKMGLFRNIREDPDIIQLMESYLDSKIGYKKS